MLPNAPFFSLQKRRCKRGCATGHGSAGFSILSVMVALVLVTIGTIAIFTAVGNSIYAGRVISSAKAFRDIESGLRAALVTITRTKAMSAGCASAVAISNLAFGSGTFSTATSIPAVNAAAGNLKANATDQTNAAARCAAPRAPANLNSIPADFYFCMLYSVSASTAGMDGSNFEKSPNSFIEVRGTLFDPRTGTNISCNQFQANPLTSGIRVGYALYWKSPVGQRKAGSAAMGNATGWLHNSKLGFFYAGQ